MRLKSNVRRANYLPKRLVASFALFAVFLSVKRAREISSTGMHSGHRLAYGDSVFESSNVPVELEGKGRIRSFSRIDTKVMVRPFKMPIEGADFRIFQPLYDIPKNMLGPPVLAPPEEFISMFEKRLAWLDTFTEKSNDATYSRETAIDRARNVYLEMLKSHVSGTVYNSAERSVKAELRREKAEVYPFNFGLRRNGMDWTYLGDTMTGWTRIDNVRDLLLDVFQKKIPGDYIETGVWRGGSSMFARGVMRAYGQSTRKSFVCDSFRGLPAGDKRLAHKDFGWDKTRYLEVAPEIVASGFEAKGLLDPNTIFAQGFFNETMPRLSPYIESLAIIRLDGDMYESTVDVLYTLYEKLSIGGYVIVDDWTGFPAKLACMHFFKVHNMEAVNVTMIDKSSAYWKKTEQIKVQYWRYEQNMFT